ncbi:uncharacterized protein LOC116297806 [Actinia tenebrosa]|uniref:Uncharacterized protein LOC116297806 n=1 Tax=Actinia tenebrosa TaxID=6105 RepID=A0A6P8I9W4_ACTTE|nr:uncharacterized protein LOC116297806 [Actinia tenebrosa]
MKLEIDRRLVRNYGYNFKGKRAEITRTAVRGERHTSIAAIGMSGLRCPQTVKGSVNGHDYAFFIQRHLLPVINPFNGINSHSVVIMDNAAIHHVDQVRELIEGAGALLLFLSPYSPDLNPIEEAFSKVKYFIRMNDIVMESADDPEPLITEAFYRLSSFDCHGLFRHCEYAR